MKSITEYILNETLDPKQSKYKDWWIIAVPVNDFDISKNKVILLKDLDIDGWEPMTNDYSSCFTDPDELDKSFYKQKEVYDEAIYQDGVTFYIWKVKEYADKTLENLKHNTIKPEKI